MILQTRSIRGYIIALEEQIDSCLREDLLEMWVHRFRIATLWWLVASHSSFGQNLRESLAATAALDNGHGDDEQISYGIDVSFPIQRKASTNYPWLPHNVDPDHNPTPPMYVDIPIQPLGDRQSIYVAHLNACRSHYGNTCDRYELDRMLMNLRQPQSVTNYTQVGFQKIRAPERVYELVSNFWQHNHYKGKPENWQAGNSYLNHWDSPTYLVSVDDKVLRGSGPKLKEEIWAAASATLEEWTSEELQPVSMYGIRVYGEGAIMLPHVDRLPLVASAMINVAQDVDEPWPFELYDHDGRAHNVTLEPGDMLLFESHSVVHAHPYPLKGRYVSMIFMHFEPTGNSLHHDESGYHYKKQNDVDDQYRNSVKNGVGGQSSASDGRLPPYIKRESPEEENWRALHPDGWVPPVAILPPHAHIAARNGQIEQVMEELNSTNNSEKLLTERDEKGWQILHQGVSSGNKEVVELLVSRGAEINARTHGGYGETPLRIAEKSFGPKHPIVTFLKSIGALSLGPEL